MICAKDLLKDRIRWRVDNEKNLRIWGDKWLLSPSSFKIQSPTKNLHDTTLVKELLGDGGSGWNIPLVLNTFWSEEAEFILSILISKRGGEDKLIWGLNSKGIFTMKSTYYATI